MSHNNLILQKMFNNTFDNPTLLGKDEDLGFDFQAPDNNKVLEELLKPEEFTMGEPLVDTKTVDSTSPQDTQQQPPKETIPPERAEEFSELSNLAPAVAQLLADNGFFSELPADVDVENFDQDALIKTVKHNMELTERTGFENGVEYERSRLVEGLPQTGLKLVDYLQNPNLDDEDIKNYLSVVLMESNITNLDPNVSGDAENIVRAFYNNDARFTRAEIDEKITELLESDTLLKEANRLKPKVDAQASKNAQDQVEIKKQMREQENLMHGHMVNRTKEILRTGNLNGIPLLKEDAELVYSMMANNEVKVPVKGGKHVEMGVAEAMIFKHKYTQEGNLENLMLGLLVMAKGPQTVERYFAQKARTQETEKVIKEQKFSFGKKSGGMESPPDVKKQGGTDFSFIHK